MERKTETPPTKLLSTIILKIMQTFAFQASYNTRPNRPNAVLLAQLFERRTFNEHIAKIEREGQKSNKTRK